MSLTRHLACMLLMMLGMCGMAGRRLALFGGDEVCLIGGLSPESSHHHLADAKLLVLDS